MLEKVMFGYVLNNSLFSLMKNFTVLTVSIITTLSLIGCGELLIDQPAAMWESIQIDTVTKNVEDYMKLTLESVPGDSSDYEKAKNMLAPNLASEFTSPEFVPLSYCIQNNPEDMKVESVSFNDEWNRAEVIVYAKYGGEWMDMWRFMVVLADGNKWLIENIICWKMLNDY